MFHNQRSGPAQPAAAAAAAQLISIWIHTLNKPQNYLQKKSKVIYKTTLTRRWLGLVLDSF